MNIEDNIETAKKDWLNSLKNGSTTIQQKAYEKIYDDLIKCKMILMYGHNYPVKIDNENLSNKEIEFLLELECVKLKNKISLSQLVYLHHECNTYSDLFKYNIPKLENKIEGIQCALKAVKDFEKDIKSNDSSEYSIDDSINSLEEENKYDK